MQKACCSVFGVLMLIAMMVLILSLWHIQADSGQFWSHRCHREGEVENDLEGCKAALKEFDGIEVDVRWNGVEVWNNESFWLHHDDASLSSTRLVDLLEVVEERYKEKKLYLDCKFRDVLRFDTVAGYLLTTVERYKLLDENVFIQWNRNVQVSSPYWTVSKGGTSVLVETFWDHWFKYWWVYPVEYTIVFTQNAFETMLWLLPCLPQSMFDDGVEVILWKSWEKYECGGGYPSLFAWKWLFYTLLLGVVMECVVVIWVVRGDRREYMLIPKI